MKKLFKMIITTAIMLSIFGQVVFAAENNLDKAIAEVNNANTRIEQLVYEAIEDADEVTIKYANNEKKANKKINKIIYKLVNKTDKIAAKTKIKVEKQGFEAYCELEAFEIGGRTVWIDPIIICGW